MIRSSQCMSLFSFLSFVSRLSILDSRKLLMKEPLRLVGSEHFVKKMSMLSLRLIGVMILKMDDSVKLLLSPLKVSCYKYGDLI